MAKQKTRLNKISRTLIRSSSPWREGNHVQLLCNAEAFYPAMLDAINKAKIRLLLEMYLFESGTVANTFISAMVDAANRGVQVYLLFDDYGCRDLNANDRKKLQHLNIHLEFYNPINFISFRRNLFRDHRKLLIVDGTMVFVGGAGISDDFQPQDKHRLGWRETMILTQGEIVLDWIKVFFDVWALTVQKERKELCSLSHLNVDLSLNDRGEVSSRVICAVGGGRQSIKNSLLRQIHQSTQRCWIATAYFVPSHKIRKALCQAARRGVDVRLLLSGELTDHPSVRFSARRFYFHLLQAGVKIFEYQPRFMHQKILLCDDWASIGSSNIDRWNFRWNLEANQEMKNCHFANEVKSLFVSDFSQCIEYSLTDWRQRSRYHQLLEWLWGRVESFVIKYIR